MRNLTFLTHSFLSYQILADNATIGGKGSFAYDPMLSTAFAPPSGALRSNGINDLIFCSTAGCNAPTGDGCALSTTPVITTVTFSGLPATATDASGTLTNAALGFLQTALGTAVTTTACSTCSVKVTSVVDTSTGKTIFTLTVGSRRRLAAPGALAVTFSVTGASASTLAAVATAAAAPAFAAAATTALVTAGGASYSGVSAAPVAAAPATAANSTSPALLGLLALLALLVAVPAAYFLCCKKGAAAKVVSSPPAAPPAPSAPPAQPGV